MPDRTGRTGPRFAPTVVGGLAAGLAAAVAGNQAWVTISGTQQDAAFAAALSATRDASAPPVTATALVLLASWGVVLVTRGRVRRGVAVLGLLAAVGVLSFAVAAWVVAPDSVARDLPTLSIEATHTWWSYLGVLAGVLAVVTSFLGVRGTPGWPEMGRRYDAPTPAAQDPVGSARGAAGGVGQDRVTDPEEPVTDENLDLWKALDRGQDPTDPGER